MTPPQLPDMSMPRMSAPPTPNLPPMPSIPRMQDSYTCSSCNKEVGEADKKCPHCGIFFEYTENPDGTRTYASGGGASSSSTRISGRGVAGLIKIGVVVLVAIFGAAAAGLKWLLGRGSSAPAQPVGQFGYPPSQSNPFGQSQNPFGK